VTVPRPGWRRAAPLVAGVVLLVVYLASLAPDFTFWDAGEFVAAARTLGIPHPPGTPLFVLMLAAWSRLLAFLPTVVATNLFSAVVTAGAGALSVRLLQRGGMGDTAAIAGALCAGGMSSVWLNATETEVYAASLALAVATLLAADHAGRSGRGRDRVLVAYLLALAVPLHLSALLAAPAAIVLASEDEGGRFDAFTIASLGAVLLLVVALGTARPVVGIAGGALLALAPLAPAVARRLARPGRSVPERATVEAEIPPPGADTPVSSWFSWMGAGTAAMMLLAAAVAASAVAFMLVRARFDPALNQGNPSDLPTLEYVVARKQYDVPPIWPRTAPWWLQIANLFEYVDWQVALSLAPGVIPNVWRVAMTVLFVVFGMIGAMEHRRVDRRRWRAVALLTLCGTVGAVAYLNLRASPSFGWGVLPDDAIHEARERDYFFVLGFWGWGLWAGMGAVALVRRWLPARRPGAARWAGVAVAALPIALNWNAVERRSGPESEMPRVFGEALLRAVPENGVLFVAGDNDTYPLWALQQVDGLRRDVTVVTIPLLAAGWNQREVDRRTGLLPGAGHMRAMDAAAEIARAANARGRPVASSVMVTVRERQRLGAGWVARGLVYVAADTARVRRNGGERPGPGEPLAVDSAAVRAWRDRLAAWRRGRAVRSSTDPLDGYVMSLLECPALLLEERPSDGQIRSLDSTCNRR
jgi:hypothetical protein